MQFNTYLKLVKFILITVLLMGNSVSYADESPWYLREAIGLPDWLQISGEHRTRYETIDEQFRLKTNGEIAKGGDQALVFRTLIQAKVDLGYFRVGAEMEDSRIMFADSGTASSSTRLTTSIANALELLQAYIEIPIDHLLSANSQSVLRLGRVTMDIGSRRFVARNRYRNTINSFIGIDWQWTAKERKFRAFYTLPIQRLNLGNIAGNQQKFDREDAEVRFWGVYYSQPFFSTLDKAAVFLFGLNENDTKGRSTKNRNLYTFGMQFWRSPKKSQFDYQFEMAYQLGKSRRSKTATQDLNHWAYFYHAELGYRFDLPWSPRLLVQYDYASGDDDPNDGENNRFDTLYGARRFDFGPTSTLGAFARANLNSPALRLHFKPYQQTAAMIVLRGFWLASTADAWTGAGITGNDSYIGTQIEARVRWDILPKNIRLETGIAHIFAGDLMKGAGKVDSTYAYTQIGLKF